MGKPLTPPGCYRRTPYAAVTETNIRVGSIHVCLQVGINIQGEGIPKPVMTFEEASMPEYVLREVLKQGFPRPTPIQSQVRLSVAVIVVG